MCVRTMVCKMCHVECLHANVGVYVYVCTYYICMYIQCMYIHVCMYICLCYEQTMVDGAGTCLNGLNFNLCNKTRQQPVRTIIRKQRKKA